MNYKLHNHKRMDIIHTKTHPSEKSSEPTIKLITMDKRNDEFICYIYISSDSNPINETTIIMKENYQFSSQ